MKRNEMKSLQTSGKLFAGVTVAAAGGLQYKRKVQVENKVVKSVLLRQATALHILLEHFCSFTAEASQPPLVI